jgi:glycerate kinase
MAFLGAEMRPGIEVVMEAVRFEERLTGCGMVVTGEGRLDGQTGYGKTVSGVAAEASRRGIPVVAVGGEVKREARALRDIGVTAVFSVSPGPVTLEESLERAEELLEEFSLQLGRLLFRLLA